VVLKFDVFAGCTVNLRIGKERMFREACSKRLSNKSGQTLDGCAVYWKTSIVEAVVGWRASCPQKELAV